MLELDKWSRGQMKQVHNSGVTGVYSKPEDKRQVDIKAEGKEAEDEAFRASEYEVMIDTKAFWKGGQHGLATRAWHFHHLPLFWVYVRNINVHLSRRAYSNRLHSITVSTLFLLIAQMRYGPCLWWVIHQSVSHLYLITDKALIGLMTAQVKWRKSTKQVLNVIVVDKSTTRFGDCLRSISGLTARHSSRPRGECATVGDS